MFTKHFDSQFFITSLAGLLFIHPVFAADVTEIQLFSNKPEKEAEYYCIAGYVGMAGVQMIGLPGRVISNTKGYYQALIKKGDQPMVIPMKEGFEFNPKGKIYNHISEDLLQQDYLCNPATFIISGSAGHANVTMNGFPSSVTTDRDGNFSVTVPYGWSGTITPVKDELDFSPTHRTYTKVIKDSEQDFTAHFKTVTVSGAIIVGNCPLPGVTVNANYGGGSDTTDELGRFYIEVPLGWSGDLSPSKTGFSFNPPSLTYNNIQEDIDSINQIAPTAVKSNTKKSQYFDIKHKKVSCESSTIPETTLIPTHPKQSLATPRIREDLRIVTAIMNERLGAFATQTQGIYIQDYGFILHAQLKPAFTFQAFPQNTQTACADDHYLDLLQNNTLKLMSYTSKLKTMDPNQWIVVTLAIPRTINNEHAMTLQVRKHDVDAFAANQMNIDEFKRNVKITVQ